MEENYLNEWKVPNEHVMEDIMKDYPLPGGNNCFVAEGFYVGRL